MVIGKVGSGELLSAILAAVLIPCIDVLPGEPYGCVGFFDHPQEPDHRGKLDGEAHGMDLTGVFFENLDFAEHEKSDCLLPVNDP